MYSSVGTTGIWIYVRTCVQLVVEGPKNVGVTYYFLTYFSQNFQKCHLYSGHRFSLILHQGDCPPMKLIECSTRISLPSTRQYPPCWSWVHQCVRSPRNITHQGTLSLTGILRGQQLSQGCTYCINLWEDFCWNNSLMIDWEPKYT